MKYKVLFLKELDVSGKQILWDDGAEVIVTSGHSEDAFIKEIREHQVDAMMCRTEMVTPAMMDASPNLKVIAKHGVGLNNIDMEYATKKGIQVVYAPLGNTNSVAEHVLLLMLMTARRYRHVDQEFRSGNFNVRYTLQDTFELENMTLGILGCGRMGQIIANKAALGFGMRVIGYDPYAKQEHMKAPVKLLENRDDVLAQADVISLNLPSLPSTRGSINYAAFQKMKPKALFINCSRGDVVVEADLIKALQEGIILGAGLDVFDQETIDSTNPMLEMDNVIMTPHTAATTRQAVVRCCSTAAQGIVEVMNGKPITFPGNKVN
ncbi:hydroxyacid dehydrogenase [Faecalispora anaeroviscerum]|uniref:hydroxyacid dehydrogenase n=1 Tax=Faecalispora anaeroviscerum TaxID=2991836 RepID=UPI0024BA6AF7|nr:hydroxyacid dehydrogenase [Faecalispora anaeroviscerum]